MVTNILEYLETTAQRTPERIAFVDENGSMTFAELMYTAQSIGSAVT